MHRRGRPAPASGSRTPRVRPGRPCVVSSAAPRNPASNPGSRRRSHPSGQFRRLGRRGAARPDRARPHRPARGTNARTRTRRLLRPPHRSIGNGPPSRTPSRPAARCRRSTRAQKSSLSAPRRLPALLGLCARSRVFAFLVPIRIGHLAHLAQQAQRPTARPDRPLYRSSAYLFRHRPPRTGRRPCAPPARPAGACGAAAPYECSGLAVPACPRPRPGESLRFSLVWACLFRTTLAGIMLSLVSTVR